MHCFLPSLGAVARIPIVASCGLGSGGSVPFRNNRERGPYRAPSVGKHIGPRQSQAARLTTVHCAVALGPLVDVEQLPEIGRW